MKYYFKYQTIAFNLWWLSISSIYSSMLGLCNVIFTIAMILLTMKFWGTVNVGVKILLIFAISLFTIFQPIIVYYRAKKQVAMVPRDIEIGFDDRGVHVKIENQTSDLTWNQIKGVSKKPRLIVVLSTSTHGFILTNKVLGQQKEEFYTYVISKIKK